MDGATRPRPQPIWRRGALAALAIVALGCARLAQAQPPPAAPPSPAALPPAAAPQPAAPEPNPAGPALPPRGEAEPAPLLPGPSGIAAPPGEPRTGRARPIPGSIFDPGASGPGIGRSGREMFLGGALDPRSGWPFVWLHMFRPRPHEIRNIWIVHTRDCPQEMGTDPWPCLKVKHFNAEGELEDRDPADLLAQAAGHPVLIQVQGSLTTPDIALGGLMWTHCWLDYHRVTQPDTVIIAFDWPSQRVYRLDVRDINEKGRRAYVAAYHLARFVQAFPPESRICLLGQSYGGRVVTGALHLLGGGCLNSQAHDPAVHLPAQRPDLHVRAMVLGAAFDHVWLNPGQRFDHALLGCEAYMNFYNRRDEALFLYPLLVRSGHRHAAGRVGLRNPDLNKLGPLAARYAEEDTHDELGPEHTLLDAVANPHIARRMAPYLWSPDPGPLPAFSNAAATAGGYGSSPRPRFRFGSGSFWY